MYGHETVTERFIDLTHVIEPTDANNPRKFVVHIHDALEEIPGKVRPKDEWYVMSDVELMNHVGTHIEVPFHCLKKGADLAQISVNQLVGDALILDLREAEAAGGVTLEQVKAAAKKAGGIRRGDIVAAPSDLPVIQARIAVDVMVRILEKKDYYKHVAPEVMVVDRNNIRTWDPSTTLAPRGFRPIFSINE